MGCLAYFEDNEGIVKGRWVAYTSLPILTITDLENDGIILETDSFKFRWTATDEFAGIDHYDIKMDDGNWVGVNGNEAQTRDGIEEGQHNFSVKAVDGAGNEAVAVRMFYVDINPPLATITSPGNHSAINDNTLTIEWAVMMRGPGRYFTWSDGILKHTPRLGPPIPILSRVRWPMVHIHST